MSAVYVYVGENVPYLVLSPMGDKVESKKIMQFSMFLFSCALFYMVYTQNVVN